MLKIRFIRQSLVAFTL